MKERLTVFADMCDYDAVLTAYNHLDAAIQPLLPLVRKMYLLSSNAFSCVARAGRDGDIFGVLAQDIQSLGDTISACICDIQSLLDKSLVILANLLRDSSLEIEYTTVDEQATSANLINEHHQLADLLRQLALALSPVGRLIQQGEHLAVFSSVEAANSDARNVSFEAVASRLKMLVVDLKITSKQQNSLLHDLTGLMEQQQLVLRVAVQAA